MTRDDSRRMTNTVLSQKPRKKGIHRLINGMKRLWFNIISENFSNLGKETDVQVQEAQRSQTVSPKEDYTKTL